MPPRGFIIAQEAEWHTCESQIWEGIPVPPLKGWEMENELLTLIKPQFSLLQNIDNTQYSSHVVSIKIK